MELLTREIILCIVVILISSSGICTAVDCGGPEFSSTIVVDKSNTSPNFTSIQAAIDSIPTSNSKWVKIQINAGIYKEKVNIPVDKPCIFIKGQGADVTTITYDDYSEITTSSTFSSFSNNLVASDITFQNSYGLKILENLRRHRKSYGIRTPSLAARISGDKCAFYKCKFIGFQDTLWDELGRHYFKNCMIEGAVDFIFGDGQSYYKDCVLNVTSLGCITAQARNVSSDPSGFVFEGGSVIGSGNEDSLLGRGYRHCSRVIFYKMNLSSVVQPVGWDAWNAKDDVTCLFYSEIECIGPGSSTSQRVPWEKNLTETDFYKHFSVREFINKDGWLSHLP